VDDRRARAEAIEGFAAVLRELRESVGNPSFREMSGRSGAISHTTLHEATKGNRLPSWETTVEFARACGADPADYRERWENANRIVKGAENRTAQHAAVGSQSAQPAQSAGDAPASPAPPPQPAPPSEVLSGEVLRVASPPQYPPPPARPRKGLPIRPAAAMLATAAVGAGAALAVVAIDRASRDEEGGPGTAASPSATPLSPADCPVRPTNPPPAPPLYEGDSAEFIGDIRLPDCTRVGTGKTVLKVWRIKNTGTVHWKGYSLRRLDAEQQADQCQTISHVPVPDTRPGRMVDIRVEVTTPRKPDFCYVRFKMVDAEGNLVFPGSRPLNFQIIVAERER